MHTSTPMDHRSVKYYKYIYIYIFILHISGLLKCNVDLITTQGSICLNSSWLCCWLMVYDRYRLFSTQTVGLTNKQPHMQAQTQPPVHSQMHNHRKTTASKQATARSTNQGSTQPLTPSPYPHTPSTRQTNKQQSVTASPSPHESIPLPIASRHRLPPLQKVPGSRFRGLGFWGFGVSDFGVLGLGV